MLTENSAGKVLRTRENKLFDINKDIDYYERVLDTTKSCYVELENMRANAQARLDFLEVKRLEILNDG